MNGYTNAATYMVSLMVSNERGLYFPTRAIAREHGNAATAAPYIRALVERALAGRSSALTPTQAKAWRADIDRSGGLSAVNWREIAGEQGADRRRPRGRTRARHAATPHRHSHR